MDETDADSTKKLRKTLNECRDKTVRRWTVESDSTGHPRSLTLVFTDDCKLVVEGVDLEFST